MDPITLILTALVTGAVAAAKDASAQAVKDGYAGLKAMIVARFGNKANVATAVAQVEQKPDSENRKGVLKEELQTAGADKDDELLHQVMLFLDVLTKNGISTGLSYTATNAGSGAIAQGPGAVAAGQGGIAVGGNVSGGIIVGDNNQVIDRNAGEKSSER